VSVDQNAVDRLIGPRVSALGSVFIAASPAAANGPESAEHGQRRHADRACPRVSHQSRKGIGDASMGNRQTGLGGQAAIGMMLRPGPPGTPRGRSIRTSRIRIGVGREPRPSGIRAATPLPLPFTDPLIGVGRGEPAERTEERAGNFEGHREPEDVQCPGLGTVTTNVLRVGREST
jgi:hypothetical protein